MAEPATHQVRVPAISVSETDDANGIRGKPSPTGLSLPNKFMRSLSSNPIEGRRGSATSMGTDPITQHIMERRSLENPAPQKLRAQQSPRTSDGGTAAADAPSTEQVSRQSIDLRPDELISSGISKEKKSRASFLSRLRAGGKKRDSMDFSVQGDDDPADVGGTRDEGTNAPVFSQPLGYIPKFPDPPKYIKVRARGKDTREFDRLFLAQELRGRTGVEIAQAGGHRIKVETKMKHDNASWAMEFSKDGHYLAAGGQGHVVRVWAVLATEADRREEEKTEEGAAAASGQSIRLSAPVFKSRPVQEYEGHTASVLSVSWSKNNFLLSSSMDKTVRLWHVSRAECLCVFKHPDFVPAVRFHPQDDRFFLAGSLDSKLRLWSIPDKNVAYSTAVSDLITAVEFSPDGKTVMAGTLSGLCVFYDTERLREQTKMHVRSTHGKNAKGSKITGIQAINFPPNDPKGAVKLLITSNDSRVRVYNMRDKSLELKLKGNENSTSQIRATFSDDAKHIICGSEDKKCYIWNMGRPDKDREKHPMEMFEAHSEVVTSAITAPAATKQLLQASGDPVFEICNPPPVQLLSREETKSVKSLKSSHAASTATGQENDTSAGGHLDPSGPAATGSSSTFKSRSSHPDGHIIITADTEGRLKCFRYDCAYKNRLKNNENWDTGSTFSKKVLQRSSSIATRASRNSIGFRDPSERILSWRQSIDRSSLPGSATPTQSQFGSPEVAGTRSPNMRRGQKPRSTSPRKSLNGLGPGNSGRRLSSLMGFSGRAENQTASHPLSNSVTNTPAMSSAGASAPSLHSNEESAKTRSSVDLQSNTKMLRQDDFSALGIRGSGVKYNARNAGKHETREDSDSKETGEEEYTSEDESEEEDGPEKCKKCGTDSFKAVRQGKGKSARTRLECANCGLLIG